ncbi:MAG: glutamine-hydrolyzing GMP synthase [Ignavibacteria bacterium]|nr:glutamine-hydrolyzing GMP synthase [Ignavibacteria bacterium]
MLEDKILVLDFGSQYSQLILRIIRELNVYAKIFSYNLSLEKILEENPKGIVLSGGPSSVFSSDAPKVNPEIYNLNIPILGICYGLQLLTYQLGGSVERSVSREFGRALVNVDTNSSLFQNIPKSFNVWMSHSDKVTVLPKNFESIASTGNTLYAAVQNSEKNIYGLQFHPEVHHTEFGKQILENFVLNICKCSKQWFPQNYIQQTIEKIRAEVGDKKVVCALSGGVDSTVSAVLVYRAIADKLICVHVDNGLMRKDESQKVLKFFKENLHLPIRFVEASEIFLSRLKGITHPEEKRKIIGNTFIEVFEDEIAKLGIVDYLVQGTLYPDVIDSTTVKGPSSVIKTHHNVGGLPANMRLKLIEPLKELFKDEVRMIGKELNIPEEFLMRHPFPGPGLGVRILGEISKEKLDVLREVDDIFITELKKWNLYKSVWQAFSVLLPIQSVGVMGDSRTYEYVVALRAVTSVDGMTADWANLNSDFLRFVSNRIVNEVRGVNRVVYDITSKPPATIEWE